MTDEKEKTDGNKVDRPTVERLGEVGKCPVCGSAVDPEAYHCPACRNYFCYHCRARLVASDTQLQCVEKDCGYYGKLVCDVCDEGVEKEEPPVVYAEPDDGYWPGWLVVALVALPVVWYYTSFRVAAWSALGLFVARGILLQLVGVNIFGKVREVEQKRRSTIYLCIKCNRPVKKLHEGS